VEFDGNNVENYDGGALYLNSLSQIVLHSGAFLNFVDNTGRCVCIIEDYSTVFSYRLPFHVHYLRGLYIRLLCFSFFSFGAGIVVETPSRLSLFIGRTTNLCFMQYEKQFVPSRTWTNVSTYN